MRKKTLATRLMSVLLSAAVVVTSSNGSALLMNAQAEPVSEETVSVNSAEESSDVAAEETKALEDTPAAEKDADVVTEVNADGHAGEEGVSEEEEIEADNWVINEGDLVDETMIGDPYLRDALLEIYNSKYKPEGSADIKAEEFTQAQLSAIGEVDLSAEADAAAKTDFTQIKDCTGIGHVNKAVKIDLTGTSVEKISDAEFSRNEILKIIVLPDNMTAIGENAFRECTSLENVNVFVNGEIKNNTLPSKLKNAGSNIFNGCTGLKEFTIPDFDTPAVLQESVGIFEGCKNLEKVDISAKVSVIPRRAFYGAGAVSEEKDKGMTVTIAEGSELNNILGDAFRYCNMTEIDLSKCQKLAKIGEGAFSAYQDRSSSAQVASCPLVSIKMPKGNASLEMGDDVFFKTPLISMYTDTDEKKVIIPDYVKSLGKGAFYYNQSMTELQLSAGLSCINAYTFDGCNMLSKVTQSTDASGNCAITYIGNAAFRDTEKLQDALFIGEMNHLQYIGEQNINVVKDNVQSLDYTGINYSSYAYGSDVFRGSGIQETSLPASLRVVNSRSFYEAKNLSKVTWASDGALEEKAVFAINSEAFAECPELQSFTYPKTEKKDAVFDIATHAFWNCIKLASFAEDGVPNTDGQNSAMPVTLGSLGGTAFGNCRALTSMKITNNEKGEAPELGSAAFAGCQALAKAELPSSLKAIPSDFYYDNALTEFPAFADGVNSIETIGSGALFGSKIETLDISKLDKLTNIGDFAFAYYYTGKSADSVFPATADETIDSKFGAPLKKAILPDKLADDATMTWGSEIFELAGNFTTLVTPQKPQEDVVYIPEYVATCGSGVFSNTAVSKAHWGFTDNPEPKVVWYTVPASMFNGTNVEKLSDCCIPAEYLVSIGNNAFMGCMQLKEVDLTPYDKLETTGTGCFANCFYLETVKLPDNGLYTTTSKSMFHVGFLEGMEGGSHIYFSSLKNVDFGGVTVIGENSFATYNTIDNAAVENGEKKDDTWPSSLKEPDLTGTKVTEVGASAFKGNRGLKTIKLGSVVKIRTSAFERCTALKLTDTPIPDTVETIADYAFYMDSALGKVTLGSGVTQIGCYTFAECADIDYDSIGNPYKMTEGSGLTEVDFSRATKLKSIGEGCFAHTALTAFDISGCPIQQLYEGTLGNCPYLKKVTLNDEMQIVNANAMYGCVRMKEIEFYSTTTMDYAAFQNAGAYVSDEEKNITPISAMDIKVKPVELNVGIGTVTKFPYYVNKSENSAAEFKEMYIGSADNNDEEVYKYVKVSAKTSGYYCNKTEKEYLVTDPEYFESVDQSKLQYSVNGTSVFTFDIEGLKPTPEGETIPFTITNSIKFLSGDGEPLDNTFTTTFDMKVLDVGYAASLYEDENRTKAVDGMQMDKVVGTGTCDTTLRVYKLDNTGKRDYYYDLKPVITTSSQPKSGNLIIETSDPNIIAVETGGYVQPVDDSGTKWRVEAPLTGTNTNVTNATLGKKFTVKAMGHGNAVITVYPECSPDQKITWDFHVRANIYSIKPLIPDAYKNGVQQGDQFYLLDYITTFLDKKVSRDEGTLEDLHQYTDISITYGSSNPDLVSIDEKGLVTINKVPETKETVTLTASFPRGDGTTAEGTATLDVMMNTNTYGAYIYTDSARTTPVDGLQVNEKTGVGSCDTTIRVGKVNPDAVRQYYYAIKPLATTLGQPESGNLMIKTSDSGVVAVVTEESVQKVDDTTWRVSGSYTGTGFKLKALGHGDAVVTVYPECSPEQKVTWNMHVRSDIYSMNLLIPDAYKNGVQPGTQFYLLEYVTTYLGKTVKRDEGTLGDLPKYTDVKIVYGSSNPQVASIDETGKVVIHKVSATKQTVTLTASFRRGDGTTAQGKVDLDVMSPPLETNIEAKDSTGASVKVTSTSESGGTVTGKVAYIKPAADATVVDVPSTVLVNGVSCEVTEIADDAFKGNTKITSVTLGTGITKIKPECFKGCTNLQTVAFRGNVTEIGDGAFQNCTSLKSITIPNSVTSIGKKAFYNCKKLSKVTISNTKSKLTRIGESAFQNCIVLTKITIPKKVKAIDKKAFYGCKKLKTVTISSSAALLKIGESAFASCAVLTKITIPKKVTSIGSKAFYSCKKLKTITVKSAGVRTVGANAFKGIYKNATITVPRAKKDAYKKLFSGKGQSSKVKIK